MLIDWFTVSAQIINFLILVWLLKRFLYQPILNAIDAREQRIATQLEEAASIKAAAQQERQTFEHSNAQIEQQRAELLTQATAQAETERQRLIEIARSETAGLREQWQQTLINEQRSLSQQLTNRTQQEVFSIARKTLTDLATVDLEQQMTVVFIQRLQAQASELVKQLNASFSESSNSVLVRSTFELPMQQHSAIETAIKDIVEHDIMVRYETSPVLLCGIELLIGGYKVGWSIDDYLQRMESGMSDFLQQSSTADSATTSKANASA